MPTDFLRLDPSEAWEPWGPSRAEPWDLRRVGHLRRRAAFGGSWDELQSDLADGPEAAVERLMAGGEGADGFDRLMDSFGPGQGNNYINGQPGNDSGLQTWWLFRIIHSPHPLRERMTLFWHDHFATSLAKVQRVGLMMDQNRLIRRHCLGKFGPFLRDMSRDPAMLVWLDSNANTKGKPNENYARELMELFSLGVGHYSETDVREAARAFTGWHTDNNKRDFQFQESAHDFGSKTVLGQTGTWNGDDIIRIILEQPAAPRFLARKLYRLFISEADEAPPDGLIEPLAERLRANDFDIADAVRFILRSRLFFSDLAFRQKVKGPVDYVAGLVHALETGKNGPYPFMPSTSFNGRPGQSGPLDGLGQTLFAPPNVKGWPGGEAWLNSATLVARHNLAWTILQGSSGSVVSPSELLRRNAPDARSPGEVAAFLLDLLVQPAPGEIDGRALDRLAAFLAEGEPQGLARDRRLRELAHAITTMPVYQLS